MHFELVNEITGAVTIASGRAIRDLARLRRQHGPARWRKLKGVAVIPPEQWAGSTSRGTLV